MWLSSTAQQAINAVLCIAGSADDGPVRVDEIANVLHCPRNYLSKTLHLLTRAGVLRSARGPKGGFQLSLAPDELSLARIVAPFAPVSERRCLIGRPDCGKAHPCTAHARWSKVAAGVEEFFAETTIADLLGDSPRTAAAARQVIRSARHSNRRSSHGTPTS